jgi:endonuclease/exonuclease/phosphatase family protein
MALTAVVWNVEQFGDRAGNYFQGQAVEDLRCLLIAALINKLSADVLVIQELRASGVPLLKTLQKLFTGTWHYDWVPGAQVLPGRVPTFNQLGFVQTGNNEGYGVLWRDTKLDAITGAGKDMSAGVDTLDPSSNPVANRTHYVDLMALGKQLTFNTPTVAPICFTGTATDIEIDFPHSVCPQAVNRTPRKHRSKQTFNSDDAIQQKLGSRRPCRVKIQVTGNRLVQMVVYHAPVGAKASRSSLYGTLIGCACVALQGTDCVYAGDYNVVADPQKNILSSYIPSIGYNAFVFAPSMVHVFKGKPSNRTFRTGMEVFGSPRDLAFTKAPTGTAPTTTVRDVLGSDIIDANGVVRQALNNSTTKTTLTGTIIPGLLGKKKGGWNQDEVDVVNDYLAGKTGNNFAHGADDHTAAAILYKGLLSDHLPIVVKYA